MANTDYFTNLSNDPYSSYLECDDLGIRILIPSMPEVIELARDNEYDMGKSPLFPDGTIARYVQSDPIHIPFSFTLSSQDPNCLYGPADMVNMARLLHAMAEPAIPNAFYSTLPQSTPTTSSGSETGSNTAAQNNVTAQQQDTGDQNSINTAANGQYYMPPPVTLMIFESTTSTVGGVTPGCGLNMNGFLKNVKASLRAPWVKAEGYSGRLPSNGEFSFTFVYFPSYTGLVNATFKTTTGLTVNQYLFGAKAVLSSGSSTGNIAGDGSSSGASVV